MEQHRRRSLLIPADFAGTPVDKKVAMRAKKVLLLDRPYVRKAAWVGPSACRKFFTRISKTFSRRELPAFKTREEALERLAGE